MNTNEFIQALNDFCFQNLPANIRYGEHHAYLVGRNYFNFSSLCALSDKFLLNILIRLQFPKENFLLKFLGGFTREYKKGK